MSLHKPDFSRNQLIAFALIFAILGGGYLLLRSQAAAPPLKWAPPGYDGSGNPDDPANYPGYNVIDAPTGSGSLNLDDNKDYFVNLGHAQWSSYPFTTNGNRTSIQIAGGRNVVIIGGKITFNSTNKYDDQTCLQIDDGNAEGTVHIEGVEMQCVNGITIRTKRTVQLENDRITVRTYNDDHTYNHPDVIQVWDRGPANAIRINRLSAYSTYTGLSNLLTPAPLVWENYQVDIHALPPLDGSLPSIMGAFVYHNSGNTPPSGPFTQWKGSDLWVETGYYNLSWRRKLDDVGIGKYLAGQQGYTTNIGWPYELYPGPGQSGTKYTSPAVPTSGSSCATNPCDLGRRQGDRLTFERVPEIEEEWNWGKAPTSTGADSNGNFVPAGYAGTSYVSPGYEGISTTPPPTVSLTANPTSITSGSSSTLTWSSTNATSCSASGAWTGSKATSGTQSVSPTTSSTYTLTCTGSGGSAAASATISVSAVNPPPPPPPPPTSCTTGQFLAKYYANTTLSGTPVTTGCETSINDDWGAGSPAGLPVDGFSASWEGSFSFEAGTYGFTATVDDGVRLYVDGQLLIDKWFRQSPTTYTAAKALTAGSHQVKVEYYEEVGGATIQASWTKQAMTATPGDVNSDNSVNILDLSILLSNWNTSTASCDLNTDGTVNILDLSILLSNYGT